MTETRQRTTPLADLRADFGRGALVYTVAVALILAMVNMLLAVALISLVFRGDLSEFLAQGIGFALVGSSVAGFVIALGSSFRGLYAGIQDAPSAIVGLSAVSIAGTLAGAAAFDTVVAMIVATSLVTGVVFLAMGYLGLGDVARFVPFPVIGGLLAGTGYLIVTGAVSILGLGSLGDLFGGDLVGTFWPALALAVLFFAVTRLGVASRAYLVFLVVAVAGFHLVMLLTGTGQGAALDRGWLLGPFPAGSLWPGTVLDSLVRADWGLIAGEAVSLITVLVIAPVSVLLYISALEIETRTDVDMNRELLGTGWANVAAGAVGGVPGYLYLADTVIAARLVGMRRGPAVLAPVLILAVVLVGSFVLEVIPTFVVGGLLLFVGAEFLYEWIWSARRRMTGLDYLLMLIILGVIATIGFLPGVGVGLVAAVVLFVVRYSRIDVVKHAFTGSDRQSNMERAEGDVEYLIEHGDATLILELQGFVFFGTASRILTRIRRHFEETPRLSFVVCDFRRVSGIDSSAVAIFERIALLVDERATALVLTGLGDERRAQFGDLIARYPTTIVVEPDLDHGAAWCEDRLLEKAGLGRAQGWALPENLRRDLAPYLEERTLEAGEMLMRQGDPSPGIYLISAGRATVLLDRGDGNTVRLRTLLGGTVLGEISLYRDEPCTATVVADTDCEVLHLNPESFDRLCQTEPAVAAGLHQFVARTLAGRVGHANRTIRALQD